MLRSRISFALAFALAVPSVAFAQSAAEGSNNQLAASHYATGAAEYQAGHFREAAAEFRVAYELSREAALLYNIASASYDAGDLSGARDAYVNYLHALPTAPNRTLVEARIASIEQRLPSSPAPVASAAPVATPVVAASMAPAASTSPVATAVRVTPRTSPLPAVGIALAVGGAIALGVGGGLYVDTSRQFNACVAMNGCVESQVPRGEDLASVGLMWGGGAVLLSGAAVFLVSRLTHGNESSHPPVAVSFDPRGMMFVQGAF